MATVTWNGSVSDVFGNNANWTPNGAPGAADDVLMLGAGFDPNLIGGIRIIDDLTINPGTTTWGFALAGNAVLIATTLSLSSGFFRVGTESTFSARFVDGGSGTGRFINLGTTAAFGGLAGSFLQFSSSTAQFFVAGSGAINTFTIEDDGDFSKGSIEFEVGSATTNDKIVVGGLLGLGAKIVVDSFGGYVFESGKTWTLIQDGAGAPFDAPTAPLSFTINNGGGLGYFLGTLAFSNNLVLRSFASNTLDATSGAIPLKFTFDDRTDNVQARVQGGDFVTLYDQAIVNVFTVNGTSLGDTITFADFGGFSAAHGMRINGQGGNDTLIGGNGRDIIDGGAFSDSVDGGDGNDDVFGSNENDTVSGGGGDDSIFGGNGTGDVAVYRGNWVDYAISQSGGGVVSIFDLDANRDGHDTLTDFEFYRFNGLTFAAAALLSVKPTAVDDAGTGNAAGNALSNDTDANAPAGDTKTVNGIRLGAEAASGTFATPGTVAGVFGTLTIAADGSFSYVVDTTASSTRALAAGQVASEVFTYRVRDSKGLTDAGQLTITINGTNDAPEITSNGGLLTASINVAENLTPVTSVTSTDADSTSRAFAIAGADAALFSIDAATGALTFKAAPDFETRQDANRNNVYEVTVTASDGNLTDTQDLSISIGNVAGNTVAGTSRNNKITLTKLVGGKGATNEEDTIDGKGGNDRIDAAGGNDTVKGGAGDDLLNGGLGLDRLRGDDGRDTFVFKTALGTGNVDKLTDFKHDIDHLQLSKAVFAKIGASLDAAEFFAKKGALKAHDRDDRIIYDTKTGKLFYDDDGNKRGGHEAVHFATLSSKPLLDHGDFVIV